MWRCLRRGVDGPEAFRAERLVAALDVPAWLERKKLRMTTSAEAATCSPSMQLAPAVIRRHSPGFFVLETWQGLTVLNGCSTRNWPRMSALV